MAERFFCIVDERAFGDPEDGIEFECVHGWKEMVKACADWPGSAVVEIMGGDTPRRLVGATDQLSGVRGDE